MTQQPTKGVFADKLPAPQFSCIPCGAQFGTKRAMRTHNRTCPKAIEIERRADAEWDALETIHDRIRADLSNPAMIARAKQEWNAA